MERKLTAILSADVKGYSRLMGEDEEGTIHTLTVYREVMTTFIQQHGRVVDSPGDNLLAEFASVVDAVRCAVEIQQALKAKNAALPDHRKMEFRIGLNLGDVVVEGERIYGDGVNIAARVEGLAEPGGICLSGTVHDQIENKLALSYEYVGEQTVKNIAKPVRVWRVVMDEAAAALAATQAALRQASPETRGRGTTHHARLTWPKGAMVLMSLLLLVGGIISVHHLSFHPPTPSTNIPLEQPPALPLPDKPSLIVLPFVNLSKDPDQDYFSDGLTETLTGDLSKISSLFVIARNSAFTYKGKAVKVQDVGREMGVRYVLEGSVLKADNQVRINAQLIDTTTGYHLWSERYDRDLKGIFALQDEITQKILTALQVKLTQGEQAYLVRKRPDNLEAYDSFLRGWTYYWRFTKEANTQARQMFERAINLDPKFAAAYAGLSIAYLQEWVNQWSLDPQTLEQVLKLGQRAIALEDSLPLAHTAVSWVYLLKKQLEPAIAESERAIALDPNYTLGYADLALLLNFAGRPEEAIGLAEKAMRLDPHYPAFFVSYLGHSYYWLRRYEEAIAAQKRALTMSPDFLHAHAHLAAIYSELGRKEEAQAEAAEVLRISPNYSLEVEKQRWPFKDPAAGERWIAALRKAGLK
jgi:adenylate cyclase